MNGLIKFLLCFLIPINGLAFAETDSLFSGRAKPLLIFNFASSDCIMCRSSSVNIMKAFSDSSFDRRIILLSDTKGMAFFFRKNDSLFGKYEQIYDEQLSKRLSLGYSSTVSVISDTDITSFSFTSVSDSIIRLIKKKMVVAATEMLKSSAISRVSEYAFNDSLLPRGIEFANSYFNDGSLKVFNAQIQLGYTVDPEKKTVRYDETEIDTPMIKRLIVDLKEHGVDSTCDLAKTLSTLKGVGIDAAQIKKITPEYTLFQFNSVYEEPKINDTAFVVAVMGRFFLALDKGINNDKSQFDLSTFKRCFYLENTRIIQGELYKPFVLDYPIIVDRNQLFCIYGRIEEKSWRPTKQPKLMAVRLSMKGNKLSVASVKDISSNFDSYSTGFFKIFNKHLFFFDQTKKRLTDLTSNVSYPYDRLNGNNPDSLDWIFDYSFESNLYTGRTVSNAIVVGKLHSDFSFRERVTLQSGLDKGDFALARIFGDLIVQLAKSSNGETIVKCFKYTK